jgi:hypothetical protein
MTPPKLLFEKMTCVAWLASCITSGSPSNSQYGRQRLSLHLGAWVVGQEGFGSRRGVNFAKHVDPEPTHFLAWICMVIKPGHNSVVVSLWVLIKKLALSISPECNKIQTDVASWSGNPKVNDHEVVKDVNEYNDEITNLQKQFNEDIRAICSR